MTSTETYTLTDSERKRIADAQKFDSDGGKNIARLIAMLTEPSWVVRREVVTALATLGEEAVVALCRTLVTQRDSEARIAATVDALVASEFPAEMAVTLLASHSDPAIVADVAQILGRRRRSSSLPTLIQLTQHKDDNVAVGAIEALGRIGGRTAVEALVDSVKSGNFFRTFPAIDVLGRCGDPRVVEPLARLLSDPSYRPEAARALGRTGARSAVKPLLELLHSPSDASMRVAATSLWDLRQRFEEKSGGDVVLVDELIRSHVRTDAIARLTQILQAADAKEAVVFCQLLGVVGRAEAAPVLTTLLDSAAPVAAAAASALKKIGRDADQTLSRALRDGGGERRKILLPVVTRFGAAVDVAKCLTDPDREVRALACDTLARIGNTFVVSEIFPLLADTNLRVVHAATAAIQALGSREARELAVKASQSPNPGVRKSALRILAYFGDASALAPMLNGLTDADPRVREAALQGLPYLESPQAIEAILEATKDPVEKTRALAMRSLGQVVKKDPRVLSILLRGTKDADAWVRYYACQSLGRLEYHEAATEIAALLFDEAGQVRVSAVEALSHLDSPTAHQTLRDAAKSPELEVKRAALVGLGFAHRPGDLPVVLLAATEEDGPTRLMAISALTNFSSPLVVGALSSAAADPDENISSTAIKFLAARPEQEATETLVELLGSEETRDRARTALLIPAEGRVAGLLVVLEVATDELAPALISILTRIDRQDARAGLLAAMRITNVAARKAAASGLAARRDPAMTEALKEAAEADPDPTVRQICRLLLNE